MEKRKEKKEPRNLKDLAIEDNNPARMKFVDLYNERWEEKFDEAWYFQYQNRFDDVHIISKKMGFIWWLIERDKLDLEKLKDNMVFTMFTHCVWIGCERHTAKEWDSILKTIWTDALIAYTAIQDNPISFLLSILD